MMQPRTVAALCKRHAQTLHSKEPEAPSTWRGRLARRLLLAAALTVPAQAQLDTSGSGMSDIWERHFNNGELFDPENPVHHPDADPDGDGWTNYQEFIAGTDPFSANPPDGVVAVLVAYIHGSNDPQTYDQVIVTWDTLPGKQYTLKVSPDLTATSWTAVGPPILGSGQPEGELITLNDAVVPDRLFWRVHVDDPHIDSDGDGLTDYEEFLLGSNPLAADTSGDGIPDRWLVVHGFNPSDNHELVFFQDSEFTVPEAYHMGVQAHPDATLDDFDGDGVPNSLDAVSWEPHASWQKSPESSYLVIPLGVPSGADGVIYPWEQEDLPENLWWLPQGPAGIVSLSADGGVLLMEDRGALISSKAEAAESTRMWRAYPGGAWEAVTWPSNALVQNGSLSEQGVIMGRGLVPLFTASNQPTDGPGVAARVWLKDGNQTNLIHDSVALMSGISAGPPFNVATSFTSFPTLGRVAMSDTGQVCLVEATDIGMEMPYRLRRGMDELHQWDDAENWGFFAQPEFVFSRDGDVMYHNGVGLWLEPSDPVAGSSRPGPNIASGAAWITGSLARLSVPVENGVETRMAWLQGNQLWIEQANGDWIRIRRTPEDVVANADGIGESGVGGITINHRGEILVNKDTLWRNGAYHPIDSLVHDDAWGDFSISHLNNTGVMVGFSRKNNDSSQVIMLVPMEAVPEVLAVNSNFDEGRIDPDTGYAIPDCDDMPGVCPVTGAGNSKMTLKGERDHLDGKYTEDEIITNYLHEGWFGVHPKTFGVEFWEDASVTIKKIEKFDEETGYPETGQVRFYAVWGNDPEEYRAIPAYDLATLLPAELVTGGIHNKENESVYGGSSVIPDNAQFYMEGVRPGRITLEWRYQKNDLDLTITKSFSVVTKKTRSEWQQNLNYQIRLQSSYSGNEIDVTQFKSNNEFIDNISFIQAIYSWYEQIFAQSNDSLLWSGMAKMAGATVYAAMSDSQVVRTSAPGIGVELAARDMQRVLMRGNKDIFDDLGWQHRAFIASGYHALEHVSNSDQSPFPGWVSLEDWLLLHNGNNNQSAFDLALGSRGLLFREQNHVVEPVYLVITALQLDSIVSVLAENPIPNPLPLGKKFSDTVLQGNLSNFDDIWKWIASDMYPGWTGITQFALDLGVDVGGQGSGGYDATDRLNKSAIDLSTRSKIYSLFPSFVP